MGSGAQAAGATEAQEREAVPFREVVLRNRLLRLITFLPSNNPLQRIDEVAVEFAFAFARAADRLDRHLRIPARDARRSRRRLSRRLVRVASLAHMQRAKRGRLARQWRERPDDCERDIRVAPGRPSERSFILHVAEVRRPVAFSTPLASTASEPRVTFDARSPASVRALLQQMESWLGPLGAQFAIGAELIRRGVELRHGVFHLSHEGRLLAVLDMRRGKAGLLPVPGPRRLQRRAGNGAPPAAADVPAGFVRATPAELAWTYVRRTDCDLLPARYRTQTIYHRGVPRVPLAWLTDVQLLLLRCLREEPCDFRSLLDRSGAPALQVGRDLACL